MNKIEEKLHKSDTWEQDNMAGEGIEKKTTAVLNHIACYLRDIFFQNKIGRLIVRSPALEKHLIFQSGFLVFAETNQQNERLGRILYKLGRLSWDFFSHIESYITPGVFIGEVLIRRGMISRTDLKDALLFQMKNITLNLFSVKDGEFHFQEIDEKKMKPSELKIAIPDLITEGIRGMSESSLDIFQLKGKIIYPQENSQVRTLSGRENSLFYQIRGGMTADDMSERLSVDTVTLMKCLFLFYCLNLIDVGEEEIKSPAVAEPHPSSEEETQKKRIENVYARFMELNFYQLLDVPRSVSSLEAKEAYYNLARLYHPDLYSNRLPLKSKTMVEQIFDRINKAYQTLSNERLRRMYDTQIDRVQATEGENLHQQADANYRKAIELFQKSRYQEALSCLVNTMTFQKNNASFFQLLGKTRSRIPFYRKQAEAAFLEAIRLEPHNAEGYVDLGIFYREEGLVIKASRQFEKALNIEPGNRTARAELKNIRSVKKGSKNIFRRN